MPLAQEKKLEKKRRILESAYQLFKSKNIYNTAVDDIVKAAGIARGTFYLYFKDKSDLIEQLLFFKSAENMKAVMAKAVAAATAGSGAEGFTRTFLALYIDYLIEQKETLAVIQKNISACMKFFPEFYDEDAKTLYTDIMKVFLREGYTEEEFRRKSYMALEMIGAVCADAILYGRPYDMETMRLPLTEAVLRVLRKDEPLTEGNCHEE